MTYTCLHVMTITIQEKMMNPLKCADRMLHVHSDIRGPLFMEAMEMQRQGKEILKLNILFFLKIY